MKSKSKKVNPIYGKWANGGGLVERFSIVDERAVIDKTSAVKQTAQVHGESTLINSTAEIAAKLFSVELVDSIASDFSMIVGRKGEVSNCGFFDTSHTDLTRGGIIDNTSFYGSGVVSLAEGEIIDCTFHGGYTIYESPFIFNCSSEIGNCFTVRGDANLEGFVIPDKAYIHKGVWKEAPKVVHTPYMSLTECEDGHINIGCQCRKKEVWLHTMRAKFITEYGCSETEYQTYRDIIEKEF